ncbi:hypothetical protein VTO42DRAFT_5056 [Malbranchea cinnamomea]
MEEKGSFPPESDRVKTEMKENVGTHNALYSNQTSEEDINNESSGISQGDNHLSGGLPSPVSPTKENGDQQSSPRTSPQKLSRNKTILITGALCLATFLAALDMTIITTALPTISKDFQMSEAGYTWIGSSYLLAAAATSPSWGKISDIFGRKPILLVANVTFLIGSLLCAVSVNTNMLIGSRAVQGVGGGGLIVLVNICISDLFSMRSRSIYFSILGIVWGVAGAVGPVIGGLFTQLVTWRWCFYINLPLDGIALVITFFFLEVHTPKTPLMAGLRAIDWLGSVAIVGGTVMFLLGLEYGGVTFPWSSPTVICLLVFGLVGLVVFILIEWKVSRYPIMPLWLFVRRATVATFIVAFIHASVYIAGSYYLPLYFQIVLGASPLQSGVYLLPFVVASTVSQLITGYLVKRTGQSVWSVWLGMAILVVAEGLYTTFPATMSMGRIIAYQIVAGIAVGPNFQAIIVTLQSHLRTNDIAAGTSTFGFIRNMANSVSVVIGGVIFHNRSKTNLNKLSSVLSQDVLAALEASSPSAATDAVRLLPDDHRMPVLEAYANGLKVMWIFYTALSGLGFLVSLLIQRKKLTKEHEITKTGLDVQEQERRERLQREQEKKNREKKNLEA